VHDIPRVITYRSTKIGIDAERVGPGDTGTCGEDLGKELGGEYLPGQAVGNDFPGVHYDGAVDHEGRDQQVMADHKDGARGMATMGWADPKR
jgi:hypothetical protein